MSPQRLIMLVFFLQPLAFGSWLPRIPDIQQRLSLGPADLALALLGLPVGILLTLPFAGPLVARIGARAAIRFGFAAFFIAVCLPAFSINIGMLFGTLLLLGVALSTLELGLNVKADETEKATGSVIMSTCHGFWSLGMMAGSLFGAGLASLSLAPQWSVMIAAALLAPFAFLVSRALPESGHAGSGAKSEKHGGFFIPGPLLLGICVFAFGITMTEGAAADWSAVYLKQVFGAESGAAGIGYSGFAMMVAAGRFAGDWLKTQWGPMAVARVCVVAALGGVAILFMSPNYGVSLIGFGLAGFGVSVGFPLAVTAAAGVDGRSAAANVAILSLVALIGFLVGPPLIGFVAQHGGLRFGLLMLAPGLILSLILAGMLQARQPVNEPQTLTALPIGNGK
jgi:MFS family permease